MTDLTSQDPIERVSAAQQDEDAEKLEQVRKEAAQDARIAEALAKRQQAGS